MAEKITVPTLGESVTEATVSKWLKSQGEEVTADEPLVELETDKVNVEVPSPTSGVLGTITVKEGETVNVGSLLGTINGSVTTDNNIKEVNNYTPPEKENKIEDIKSTVAWNWGNKSDDPEEKEKLKKYLYGIWGLPDDFLENQEYKI